MTLLQISSSILSDIAFVVAILTAVFTGISWFKKPQVDMEKRQAVSEKEVDGKAALLAQELHWTKEANERRFREMVEMMNDSRALAQNHIHSIDVRVTDLSTLVNTMNVNIGTKLVELSTIINERMPSK
jgi:membrane-bound ClpP family serine protease